MLLYYKWCEKVHFSQNLKSIQCREIPASRSREAAKAQDSPHLNYGQVKLFSPSRGGGG